VASLQRLDLVPGASDDFVLMNNDGSDGHFVLRRGLARHAQGFAHVVIVGAGVDDGDVHDGCIPLTAFPDNGYWLERSPLLHQNVPSAAYRETASRLPP